MVSVLILHRESFSSSEDLTAICDRTKKETKPEFQLEKKSYIAETGRRLGDRFREHLRDVERNDEDASKQVARHFNLLNHSKQHMVVCGLSLHLGSSESRKTLEQKFIFQIGTLNPHSVHERFSFN